MLDKKGADSILWSQPQLYTILMLYNIPYQSDWVFYAMCVPLHPKFKGITDLFTNTKQTPNK